jgi:hypothetical protein
MKRLATGFTIAMFCAVLGAGPTPTAAAPTAAASPYVARHGLTSAEYQAEFDKWVSRGYRLTDVSGYPAGAGERYAAIWRQVSGPAWQARHGLSAAEYQATFDQLARVGYRPILVNVHAVAGTSRFAAIFHRSYGVAWQARHGLSREQYQAEFDRWVGRGYRLTYVSGYTEGGAERYAAIWERSNGPEWRARHGMSSAAYRSAFHALSQQGYRPVQVSAYSVSGMPRFAAIFHRDDSVSSVARHNLTPAQYQSEFDFWGNLGYRLADVTAYAVAGSERFAAIWERARTAEKPKAIVALGDSFISGEAAGNYEAGSDGPFNYCHRSRNAEIHMTQIPNVRAFNLACSGASAANVIDAERYGEGTSWVESPQSARLRSIAREYDVEMIVLSIGGNDLHFASKLSRCFGHFLKMLAHAVQPLIPAAPCWVEIEPGLGLAGPAGEPAPHGELASAARNVESAIVKIKEVMTEPEIQDDGYRFVLQSYPSPITESVWPPTVGSHPIFDLVARGCPIRPDDAAWARTILVPAINEQWRAVARRQGIGFLDLSQAAEEREVCSATHTGREEWIRGLHIDLRQALNWSLLLSVPEIADRSLPIIQESFHPNASYHQQVGACLTSLYTAYTAAFGDGAAKNGRCFRGATGDLQFHPERHR